MKLFKLLTKILLKNFLAQKDLLKIKRSQDQLAFYDQRIKALQDLEKDNQIYQRSINLNPQTTDFLNTLFIE